MKGYTGKLVFVDLSSGEIEYREFDEEFARNYIGGYGFGAKILYDEMPAHADEFGPDSMIGFITGTMNGSAGFMGARYTVVSKSPVYKGWNDANSGGTFGPFMRMAGIDGIFVKGIADHPVYIYIDEGKAEIRDASHLWGKTIVACEEAIREEVGDKRIGMCMVGPAGERKAWTACVMNDSHRAAGRGGSGAVMGSKMLKAIVVRGTNKLEKADAEALKALNKETVDWMKNGPTKPIVDMFSAYGTGGSYESCVVANDASIKNWNGVGVTDIAPEDFGANSAQAMDEKYRVKKYACNTCPLGCGAVYTLDAYGYKSEDTGRPEYETAGGFGSQMLNNDSDVVNVCNFLANEYGLDTISLAGTVAWAMECYNEGILSAEDLDGVELKWGDGPAIVAMTEKVCKGEGVGAVLQNGSRYAADCFGRGEEALVTASGIEIAQHDSRFGPGLARTYVYDPSPGRHVKGGLGPLCGNEPPEVKYRYDDKGAIDAYNTCNKEMNNCCGYCDFDNFCLPPNHDVSMLNAVTGFDFDRKDYVNTGKRIYMLRQAFNLREGFYRDHWYLDDRLLGIPPMEDGPLAGVTVDVELMADNFFREMGIDPATGIPLKETLEELGGLEEVIANLYPEG